MPKVFQSPTESFSLCFVPSNFFAALGMVCLPQRSKGGARSAGDMSGGRYVMADAGSEKFESNHQDC
jgi:hypothetical protein